MGYSFYGMMWGCLWMTFDGPYLCWSSYCAMGHFIFITTAIIFLLCLFVWVCVCVFLYSYLRCVIFPQLTTRNGHRLDQDFDRLPRQTDNGIPIRLIITVRAIRWYSERSSLVCTGYRARRSLMHYCLSNNLVTYCIIYQSSLWRSKKRSSNLIWVVILLKSWQAIFGQIYF